MKLQTGCVYHIKDEFFDYINDKNLMTNHENGHSRPTYFVIKNDGVLWFVPLSSKVSKYEKIIENKIRKYGRCKTILIRKIANKKSVILLQNAFPILEKYISHPHVINGKVIKLIPSLKKEILNNFKFMISMKKSGKNLFFADTDKILERLKYNK